MTVVFQGNGWSCTKLSTVVILFCYVCVYVYVYACRARVCVGVWFVFVCANKPDSNPL